MLAADDSEDGSPGDGENPSLPAGWEAHEDEAGPYYWHVPSGTIRREPPGPADQPVRPRSFYGCSTDDFTVCGVGSASDAADAAATPTASASSVVSSPSPSAVDGAALATLRRRVRYLGWRYLDPEDVARAERSSGAVNRCIAALAAAEAAGELTAQPAVLELGRQSLRLLPPPPPIPSAEADADAEEAAARPSPPQPPPLLLMPSQPLLAIRLWGVGRRRGSGSPGGAGRHFAYVARDDVNKYVCHVIDCRGDADDDDGDAAAEEAAAVQIANAVCQRCSRLISQRRRRQQQQQQQGQLGQQRQWRSPPDDLRLAPASCLIVDDAVGGGLSSPPFPSPQEEPSKCIPCLYLGCVPVAGPGGVDRLNAAIDAAVAEAADGRRLARPVTARVSPSSLRFEPATSSSSSSSADIVGGATDAADVAAAAAVVVELRVRYLSFMGVGRASVRHAGFVAQTALGAFECHVCRCEPSCGPLCRTVEAACNLRYQKCLDSLAAGSANAASPTSATATAAAATAGGVKTDIVQAVTSLFSGLRRLSIK